MREVGLGQSREDHDDRKHRYLDLVAFDSKGGAYAIECKLQRNPEAHDGRILAQVRQQRERLEKLGYAQLNEAYQKKQWRDDKQGRDNHNLGRKSWSKYPTIADRMGEVANLAEVRPWSPIKWERNVDANLRGSLRSVVLLDYVDAPLERSLGAFNSPKKRPEAEHIWALELLKFEHGVPNSSSHN